MKKVSTFIRYTIEDFLYAIDWLGTREWVDGEVPSADTKYLLELLISFILLIPMHALPFRLWMQLPFLLVMLVLNFILSTFFVGRYLFKRFEAEKAAVSARIERNGPSYKNRIIGISFVISIAIFYIGCYNLFATPYINIVLK